MTQEKTDNNELEDQKQSLPDSKETVSHNAEELVNLLQPVKPGYAPLPTNVAEPQQGSVFMATLEESTSWGSLLGTRTAKDLTDENKLTAEEAINQIPERYVLTHADKFVGKDPEDFGKIAQQLDEEQDRRQLLSEHPIRSFAYGLPQQFLDPLNWVAVGEVVNSFRQGSKFLRGVAGSAISAAGSAGLQEAVIQSNNLSKEAQESWYDVAAAGVVGATLGGIGTGVNIYKRARNIEAYQSRKRLKQEVKNTLTDTDKPLTENGTLPTDDIENMPKVMQATMKLTPMNRMLTSGYDVAKGFTNAMLEKNYTMSKHLEGRSEGESVERAIISDKRVFGKAMLDYQDIYYNMAGVGKGPFRATRAKIKDPEMTMGEFNERVSRVMTTEKTDTNSHVNQAADHLRENIWEPIRQNLVEVGALAEDTTPKNAMNYFMLVYNKNKIIEEGGRSARESGTFAKTLHEYFQSVQEDVRQYKESPAYVNRTLKIAQKEKQLKRKNVSKKKKAELEKDIDALRQAIKDNAPKGTLNSKGELRAIKDNEALWTDVEQTIDTILGDKSGQLLNPILQKLGKAGSPNPLKERNLLADQEMMRPWHVTDASKVTDMYIRATVPYIHMNKRAQSLGFESFEDMKANLGEMVKEEYDAKAEGVTGKKAQKLREKRDQVIKDMSNTMDMLMGVYGDGPNVLNKSSRDFYRNVLNWNYTRLLGYMTISSFADAGIQIMANGPYRFLHEGLIKSFSDVRKISKRDIRDIGYAVETELGLRIKSFTEDHGLSTNPGPFTRGFESLTQKFGNLSLMNQWNDWHQTMAGHMSISRTLETIANVMEGKKVPKKEIERVARLGIDSEHFADIYKFTKDNVSEGSRYADWGNWNITNKQEAEALRQFQSSVGKEIDSIVVTPGIGDRVQYGLLDAHTPAGKMLLQFKTFLSASTNKVLYSGIQRRDDANIYAGIVSMLGLGALSYVTASILKGKEPDLSYQNLAHEAVDKSGLLGIFGEIPNVFGKLLGFGGVSRYQSRDLWGALTGPSGGALSDALSLINKTRSTVAGETNLNTRDARKLLRFIPLQNLAYIEWLNRLIMKDTATYLGAEDVDE